MHLDLRPNKTQPISKHIVCSFWQVSQQYGLLIASLKIHLD